MPKTSELSAAGSRVLVVDDDAQVREVYSRALLRKGHYVEVAVDGEAALRVLQERPFDVVVSDIDMPLMNGVQLLQRIRSTDLDIPVIFVTGLPSIETAIQAVGLGALKYLMKPVALAELTRVVADAISLHSLALAKRQALELAGEAERFAGDQAGLRHAFSRALESLFLVYQPIISWPTRSVYGYEALVRTMEPTLRQPPAIVHAAERLGRVPELGQTVRRKAMAAIATQSADVSLFVNLHPTDLFDDDLVASGANPLVGARRVVLEVTERESLEHLAGVRERVTLLRESGFRIALDDFGAGYGGLTSFTLLEPDIVKLDMGLVRGIATDATKQTLVRTIVAMCRDLKRSVIAEGVETEDECTELVRLGCDRFQGYWFGHPQSIA